MEAFLPPGCVQSQRGRPFKVRRIDAWPPAPPRGSAAAATRDPPPPGVELPAGESLPEVWPFLTQALAAGLVADAEAERHGDAASKAEWLRKRDLRRSARKAKARASGAKPGRRGQSSREGSSSGGGGSSDFDDDDDDSSRSDEDPADEPRHEKRRAAGTGGAGTGGAGGREQKQKRGKKRPRAPSRRILDSSDPEEEAAGTGSGGGGSSSDSLAAKGRGGAGGKRQQRQQQQQKQPAAPPAGARPVGRRAAAATANALMRKAAADASTDSDPADEDDDDDEEGATEVTEGRRGRAPAAAPDGAALRDDACAACGRGDDDDDDDDAPGGGGDPDACAAGCSFCAQWFHAACLGMDGLPSSPWPCPACELQQRLEQDVERILWVRRRELPLLQPQQAAAAAAAPAADGPAATAPAQPAAPAAAAEEDEYLIKWRNLSHRHCTWVPAGAVRACHQMRQRLRAFERRWHDQQSAARGGGGGGGLSRREPSPPPTAAGGGDGDEIADGDGVPARDESWCGIDPEWLEVERVVDVRVSAVAVAAAAAGRGPRGLRGPRDPRAGPLSDPPNGGGDHGGAGRHVLPVQRSAPAPLLPVSGWRRQAQRTGAAAGAGATAGGRSKKEKGASKPNGGGAGAGAGAGKGHQSAGKAARPAAAADMSDGADDQGAAEEGSSEFFFGSDRSLSSSSGRAGGGGGGMEADADTSPAAAPAAAAAAAAAGEAEEAEATAAAAAADAAAAAPDPPPAAKPVPLPATLVRPSAPVAAAPASDPMPVDAPSEGPTTEAQQPEQQQQQGARAAPVAAAVKPAAPPTVAQTAAVKAASTAAAAIAGPVGGAASSLVIRPSSSTAPAELDGTRAAFPPRLPDAAAARDEAEGLEFLVRWRGLGYGACTWEPAAAVRDARGQIEAMRAREPLRAIAQRARAAAAADAADDGGGPPAAAAAAADGPAPAASARAFGSTTGLPFLAPGSALYPYQLEGLNWMYHSLDQGTNVILADEMGLGKTVQLIATLAARYEAWGAARSAEQGARWADGGGGAAAAAAAAGDGATRQQQGGVPAAAADAAAVTTPTAPAAPRGPLSAVLPSLVIVPLSTLRNWSREFQRWAPQLNVVVIHGDAASRRVIMQHELLASSAAAAAAAAATTAAGAAAAGGGGRTPSAAAAAAAAGESLAQVWSGTAESLQHRAKLHVALMSYEAPGMPDVLGRLLRLRWDVMAVDEGHRLKQRGSRLFADLDRLSARRRVLLTGTPLQNRLEELFALLHFLDPAKFRDLPAVLRELGAAPPSALAAGAGGGGEGEQQQPTPPAAAAPAQAAPGAALALSTPEQVERLRELLRPHLLRRTKRDVAIQLPPKRERIVRVELSPLQRRAYRLLLARSYSSLAAAADAARAAAVAARGGRRRPGEAERLAGTASAVTRLRNLVMELRKCCNHPRLFAGHRDAQLADVARASEPPPAAAVGEVAGAGAATAPGPEAQLRALLGASGKLALLDRLMARLKAGGHRVLIYSQFTTTLDLLEDWLGLRAWPHLRVDGSVPVDVRQARVDAFNTRPADYFAFLLSTRAGGLGINLQTADTVVIFDR